MKSLATAFGVLVLLVGVLCVISPSEITTIGTHLVTQKGLYIIAILRICIGIVFLLVASVSRMPRTVRIIGAIVLVAGIITPLFGVDRSRAMLDWWASQSSTIMRLTGVVPIAGGAFLIRAVGLVRQA
jgi:hypothetical protein